MSVKDVALAALTDPKTAAAVATGTTGTGLGTLLDLIPDEIGKLATVVGIGLSVILIYAHLLGVKKTRIEINILKKQEAERVEASRILARRKED